MEMFPGEFRAIESSDLNWVMVGRLEVLSFYNCIMTYCAGLVVVADTRSSKFLFCGIFTWIMIMIKTRK